MRYSVAQLYLVTVRGGVLPEGTTLDVFPKVTIPEVQYLTGFDIITQPLPSGYPSTCTTILPTDL